MKIEPARICSAHRASAPSAGEFPRPVTPALLRRRRWRSFATAGAFVQTFIIQFNAAALREQWRNEFTPSSTDFWIVNLFFHRATSPPRWICSGDSRRSSISPFITCTSTLFLLALMIQMNTRIAAVKQL
ncbi:hypothetical protein KCP70_06890 [Salmonella enterica subsp. enterica]|nr:hypothetical protein KCP70_06890 [Salmonella enterica subsp. enterica]